MKSLPKTALSLHSRRNGPDCTPACCRTPKRLDRHLHIGTPSVERTVVREDHLLRAVSTEGGFVVPTDDGEGVKDVGRVILGQAVEVGVEGVEAGAQVVALLSGPTVW